MGGGEEMKPEDARRIAGHRSQSVDVKIRRVAGQNSIGRHDRIKLREDGLLDRHILKHRFDDQRVIGQGVIIGACGQTGKCPIPAWWSATMGRS